MSQKPDFSFLDRDIKSQKDLARQVLDEVKKLDEQLKSVDAESPVKHVLENARQVFLSMAKQLATNANTTANAAISVMSQITRSST